LRAARRFGAHGRALVAKPQAGPKLKFVALCWTGRGIQPEFAIKSGRRAAGIGETDVCLRAEMALVVATGLAALARIEARGAERGRAK
jgi:hypothetical protein